MLFLGANGDAVIDGLGARDSDGDSDGHSDGGENTAGRNPLKGECFSSSPLDDEFEMTDLLPLPFGKLAASSPAQRANAAMMLTEYAAANMGDTLADTSMLEAFVRDNAQFSRARNSSATQSSRTPCPSRRQPVQPMSRSGPRSIL